ncbi:hypothetical protein C0991_009583 [Blastosporella zonata]|nr:hypothetical protein C0991_009583 [Blastosporella zonata]
MACNTGQFLPNEVWGEVFGNVPLDRLPTVTLACKTFRSIGLPQIFQTFTFSPYFVDGGRSPQPVEVPKAEAEAEKSMEKLHFYTSASISPHVHICRIVPQVTKSGYPDVPSKPHVLLDAFFQLLPRFTNVNILEFHAVEFTSVAISQLALLPDITTLLLNACTLSAITTPSPVRARHVRFDHMGTLDELSKSGAQHWKIVLDLDRLETLKLFPARASIAFFGDSPTFPSFPNTTSLLLALPHSLVIELPIILKQFPRLSRLSLPLIDGRQRDLSGAVASRIPHTSPPPVQYYDGPYELLHLVMSGGMRSLWLTGFHSIGCDPDVLAHELGLYKESLKSIEFFKTGLLRLNEAFLSTVRSLFPSLKVLSLEAKESNEFTLPASRLIFIMANQSDFLPTRDSWTRYRSTYYPPA